MSASIDHLMSIVPDLSAAAAGARRLGFHCTQESRHSRFASANRLIVFGNDYWELLAFLEPTADNAALREFQRCRSGINGIAGACTDIADCTARGRARGLPLSDPIPFGRTVEIEGVTSELRFKIAMSTEAAAHSIFFFYCEHGTPELIWREPWQAHPNGALGIARLTLFSDSAAELAESAARVFDSSAVASGDGGFEVAAGAGVVAIEATEPAELRELVGERSPLSVLGIKVRSPQTAYERASAAGARVARSKRGELFAFAPELGAVLVQYLA